MSAEKQPPSVLLPPRLFIAAGLPSSAQVFLDGTVQNVAAQWPATAVRWTASGHHHLTLRFLGDTETARVAALTRLVDGVATMAAPFQLEFGSPGVFPANGPAKVLWMGLQPDAGEAQLRLLQQRLERGLQDLGWEAETRPYRPHLTLGRVRAGSHQPLHDWHRAAAATHSFPVTEILLMRSELHPAGARYNRVYAAPLVGP
ncbi:MAG: RNA 2',3'-cyclic phosphodiesterase [bacterium]|nr:RNA 2',3'-cyclic phosphodiesterase [bacterium]